MRSFLRTVLLSAAMLGATLVQVAQAQVGGFEMVPSVPFAYASGQPLAMPLAGGLNSAMLSPGDVNGDGQTDLICFDRTQEVWKIFIAQPIGSAVPYIYDRQYDNWFPKCQYWALLRDLNCDGNLDVITTGTSAVEVRVWYNQPIPGQAFRYPGFQEPLMTISRSGSLSIPMSVTPTDRPEIIDLDGDGDLDFVFMENGGGVIEVNRNRAVENGNCANPSFAKEANNWGGLVLGNQCGGYSFVGRLANPDTGRPKKVMHSGASITIAHLNNDNKYDLLIGDWECPQLYAMMNTGQSSLNAAFPVTNGFWPTAANPARLNYYPAGFVLDVDRDGANDIVVSTSLIDLLDYKVNFDSTVIWVRNTGTNAAPNFVRQPGLLLQDQMVDVGGAATPALADYDADGDLDLFIGQQGSRGTDSVNARLTLFENIGTATQPSFRLLDRDYADLFRFNTGYVRAQFVDLNGDGALDLSVNWSFAPQYSSHRYKLNQAPAGAPFNFNGVPWVSWRKRPFAGQKPFFTDVDADGNLDLLYGTGGGLVEYHRNTGTTASPAYNQTATDNNLGNLRGGFGTYLRYYADVVTGNIDNDGYDDMIISDDFGRLRLVRNYRIQPQEFNVDSQVVYMGPGQPLGVYEFGRAFGMALGDLNADGWQDLVVGTIAGGIHILYNRGGWPVSAKETLRGPRLALYPNPARNHLTLETPEAGRATLLTLAGQHVQQWEVTGQSELPLAGVPAGAYLLRFTGTSGQTWHERVVVQP